jgi:adenine/guanine phosphoribosyltransferase-like PRPP-binding protein
LPRNTIYSFLCTVLLPAEKVGAEIVETACIIELPALEGRKKLEGVPLFVLIEKEGE